LSNEESKKEQASDESNASAGFNEMNEFLEESRESIEKKEEEIDEDIKDEEEKVDELEEEKEDIGEKKKEIEEKIRQEKEKIEELKEKENDVEEAKEEVEEETEELKKDIEEKKTDIIESVQKIKSIFKKNKIDDPREEKPEKKSAKNFLKSIYEDHYKKLLIIPFIILLLSVTQLAYQYNATGDFVNRGVELKGGITLTIPGKSYDITELQEILNNELGGDITVRRMSQTKGLLIEASDVSEENLLGKVQEILGEMDPEKDYSLEQMGSSLGSSFFKEIIKAILIAFLLMGIVVFIAFRVPAPSLAVILAAFSDIIITLAIFNLTGAKLGKGGIAAFLMLIGYSVDTDILLSTKVLKRKFGTVMDRVYSAMKTGLTMNITTIVALSVALIFAESEVIRQIMTILLIGLCVDIMNTWIQNVGVLRLYLERKQRQK